MFGQLDALVARIAESFVEERQGMVIRAVDRVGVIGFFQYGDVQQVGRISAVFYGGYRSFKVGMVVFSAD